MPALESTGQLLIIVIGLVAAIIGLAGWEQLRRVEEAERREGRPSRTAPERRHAMK